MTLRGVGRAILAVLAAAGRAATAIAFGLVFQAVAVTPYYESYNAGQITGFFLFKTILPALAGLTALDLMARLVARVPTIALPSFAVCFVLGFSAFTFTLVDPAWVSSRWLEYGLVGLSLAVPASLAWLAMRWIMHSMMVNQLEPRHDLSGTGTQAN